VKEKEVMFGLHEMGGIGWQTIDRLKRAVGDLAVLAGMNGKEIAALQLSPDGRGRSMDAQLADRIYKASRDEWVAGRMERLWRCGASFLAVTDPDYPEWLRHIYRPPWILYGIGDWSMLSQPVLAVVGTRSPTAYGRRTAYRLAAELSGAGWRVASGMARGIDADAHAGALTGPGGTIAVLATPVDTPYPRENAGLYRRICEEGLVVSEIPFDTPLTKGLFPGRNRIISGLSLGTVVVEADLRSGSLITASFALEQNRELFAVPGPVSSPKSAGTNRLIQQSHAKLVMEAADIIEEFPGWVSGMTAGLGNDRGSEVTDDVTERANERMSGKTDDVAERANERMSGKTDDAAERAKEKGSGGTADVAGRSTGSLFRPPNDVAGLSRDERFVLGFIGDEPVTIDDLLMLTRFDFGHLHSVLLHLLMKNLIEQQPGSSFIRYF